ncbi:MAG: glycosyltransferase [Prolixibacteraceae bacterium]|nr:glycosyltransferase [Prolixibacteraceae bacterium]
MFSKIRVCYILSHLPQGGAERQTMNLIKALDPSRYDITIVLYANTEIFYKEILELPIRLLVHQPSSVCKLFRDITNALFLRRVLAENDFDVLHTLLFHNGFWVRLVAPRKYNQRIIYSIRNNLNDGPRFYLFFERLLIRRSYVITNSNKARNQFILLVGNKYNHKLFNIYNGYDLLKFNLDEQTPLGEKIIIGTVGRQVPQKNQIQILEAINQITKKHRVHFFIIGDKSYDSFITNENYVNSNNLQSCVTIMDSQPEIERYYWQFNIFVLSSIYEGCPNVLFEAMLARCLCIVSKGANSDHFVIDGINGLVYDGSTSMLTKKLEAAIELLQSENGNSIIENGHRYARENFSMHQMVNNYESIYKMIVKTKSNQGRYDQ